MVRLMVVLVIGATDGLLILALSALVSLRDRVQRGRQARKRAADAQVVRQAPK